MADNTGLTMRDMLVAMGCREWHGGANHRVYIGEEVGSRVIGLRVQHYGSGNVSNATRDGEKISNAAATALLSQLRDCYYDVGTDRFTSPHRIIATVGKELRGMLADARAAVQS